MPIFQIIDTEKAQREKVLRDSVTWPQFLKQMREDLAEETSAKVKSRQSEEDEGEDDALQEAILASIAEQKHRKQRGAPLKSTRRSLFLEDAGEEAERMNGKECEEPVRFPVDGTHGRRSPLKLSTEVVHR